MLFEAEGLGHWFEFEAFSFEISETMVGGICERNLIQIRIFVDSALNVSEGTSMRCDWLSLRM